MNNIRERLADCRSTLIAYLDDVYFSAKGLFGELVYFVTRNPLASSYWVKRAFLDLISALRWHR